MREVGHVSSVSVFDGTSNEYPQSIRWTRDGKKLSYIYRKALYTVPVE
jgi:hypothetical protein